MLDPFLNEFLVSVEMPIMIEEKTYVIVEQELIPNIMTLIYQYGVANLKYSDIFDGTAYEDNSGKGPILVQLSNENESFSQLVQLFSKQPSGCFLQTDLVFSDLLDWVRNALNVNFNNKISLFRFYEPRMLLALLGSLTFNEKSHFFKDIHSVYWFHHAWLGYHHVPDPSIKEDDFILTLTEEHLAKINSVQQRYLELLN